MPVILFVLFLVVPIVELAVILQVGEVIGVLPTVLLLLGVSVAGAVMVRREGTRAWRRFREAIGAARLPTNEVIDGALVLLGGALMLTPGFVTDAAGLLLVVPLTRPLVRRLVASRVRIATLGDAAGPFGGVRRPGDDRDGRRERPGVGGRAGAGGRGSGGWPGRGGPGTRRRTTGPDRRPSDAETSEVVDIEVVSIERNDPPGPDRNGRDVDRKQDDS